MAALSRPRPTLAAALAVAALSLAACGPGFLVVRRAPASRLIGQRSLDLLPVDFSGLQVAGLPENDYLASQDERTAREWVEIRKVLAHEFAAGVIRRCREDGIDVTLVQAPRPGVLAIWAAVEAVHPGRFGMFIQNPSEVRLRLRIGSDQGELLDEIVFHHGTTGGLNAATVHLRVRTDAVWLGNAVGEYLGYRVRGE